jgi:Na+/H+ antiporter NhaC
MITAWMLASIIGILMTSTGFVEALSWISALLHLGSTSYVVSTFVICCIVSLSTGSSFATILICGPLLYPAGGLLGAHMPTLAGAILGGATFGDFTAPISDTTIASALSQKADIGLTVRSRLKYILPAGLMAIIAFAVSAHFQSNEMVESEFVLSGDNRGWPMIFVPIIIIYLFLRGSHLIHGLMFGLISGIIIAMSCGLLSIQEVISLDLDNFVAKSIIIDGINRSVGISFFTILLMGLVGTIRASSLLDTIVEKVSPLCNTVNRAELMIAGSVWAAVMLTTHSIVAILMVSDFSNSTGEKVGVRAIRRANLLSLVVCVFPFLLPYFIPVILMASTTASGTDLGLATVSPLEVGLYNFVAWGLAIMCLMAVIFGYGRKSDNTYQSKMEINA